MKYRQGPWGTAAEFWPSRIQGEFDLVIGSDLLYERDADATLAGFIDHHAGPGAEVWIVDPDRGNRPAFNRSIAARGVSRQAERLSQPAPAGACRPAGYKCRLRVYRRVAAAQQAHPARV